ncbi:hypothetical protein [Rubritalea squalenifaciens]|nr:hypothetical protein [Rubritalea squalenifaciens]
MSFVKDTGRKKQGVCDYCGLDVELEKYESWNRDGHRFKWRAVEHRAPCGAQCAGGGYEHGETDVHIPPFGSCPRCGAIDSEIAQTIENQDGAERVVLRRYVIGHSGLRIDHEERDGEQWKTVARYPASDPQSLEMAIEQAKNYVPWLKGESP